MTWVYIRPRGEDDLWTVGFYSPDGEWHPDSDHGTREEAAERVHYLNGGKETKMAWKSDGVTEENHGEDGEMTRFVHRFQNYNDPENYIDISYIVVATKTYNQPEVVDTFVIEEETYVSEDGDVYREAATAFFYDTKEKARAKAKKLAEGLTLDMLGLAS